MTKSKLEFTNKLIDKVIEIIIASYGSLGFTRFSLHSIEPNFKDNVCCVQYSFIERGQENRIYFQLKTNIPDCEVIELKEIKEEKRFEDDD